MANLESFRKSMISFCQVSARSFPWRETRDPYAVVVSEILLQRTRGEHVIPVYNEVLRRWPTVDRLARARVSTIERVIAPLGLVKRAAMIQRLAQEVAVLGRVPFDPEVLLGFPGIGPYGAHAIPIFADYQDLPLVDWVIARVLGRYFGLSNDRRPNADRALWGLATELADMGSARELWLGVLDLGAAVCKPVPRCHKCPLKEHCSAANSSSAGAG
ncbi:MAG: A/G-specific adenine glycosylase [bacterium]|nr:A/G-specific adenine glycosylase [bacterium]